MTDAVSRTPRRRDAEGHNPATAVDESRVPQYTVRAVAERLGVPTATLRSWTQRYGVGPLEHRPGRHRLYSETDIAVLQEMNDLIRRGVNPHAAARAATSAFAPTRADTTALLAAAFALDVVSAGRLVDAHLRHYGVLDTWDELVRPTFREIADRQASGTGCIDVEHALSWTVARSLQHLPLAAGGIDPPVVLACTAGEAHTLPLEALRAALGERGCGSLMLGAAVPVDAVRDVLRRTTRPAAVVLWAQTAQTADTAVVDEVAAAGVTVMVGGPGWSGAKRPAGAVRVDSLADAVDRLTT